MAYLKLKEDKLLHNYRFLNDLFASQDIEWGVVSKLLCGNEAYLKLLVDFGAREILDSRISNLKRIKAINPVVQTVYIKPPAGKQITQVVKYADVSFNTGFETIKMLSDEACRQEVLHKVIIMVEMGDLREGVMGNDLMDFYERTFNLPGVKIVGLGTNLNCLHGVMPSADKLVQLSLYSQLIEAKFDEKIPWISAGTSVTLPLLFNKQLPVAVNHFRIGETLFFGNNLVTDDPVPGMETDIFELVAQIIEVTEKPKIPIGELAANPAGEVFEVNPADFGKKSYRAILDVGRLDISPEYVIPLDEGTSVVGASSDMLVVDLEENNKHYKVGDHMQFSLKYMGALSLLNSRYIDKVVA